MRFAAAPAQESSTFWSSKLGKTRGMPLVVPDQREEDGRAEDGVQVVECRAGIGDRQQRPPGRAVPRRGEHEPIARGEVAARPPGTWRARRRTQRPGAACSRWPTFAQVNTGMAWKGTCRNSEKDFRSIQRPESKLDRSLGANLGATRADKLPGLRTRVNIRWRCVRGHGLI